MSERKRGRDSNTGSIPSWSHQPGLRGVRGSGVSSGDGTREACVPRRYPSRLPATTVRNLERAGVSRSVAMKITGHKTESVCRRYAIVSDADLLEASRRLTGILTGIPGPSQVDGRRASVQNDSREALAQPGRAPAF